jgi:hypothetical protein
MFRRFSALPLLLCLAIPKHASAQDECLTQAKDFDSWLNCRVGRVIAVAAGPSGDEKQAEAPSLAEDSPTLVDSTSASDFVGFGITLLGMRNPPDAGSDATTGGTSITVSAYSLLAAAYGRDPLADRDFYYDHADWRRVSFTIGRQPSHDDGIGLNSEATTLGAKVLLLNLREIARQEVLTDIEQAVTDATLSYANISNAVQELLMAAIAPGTGTGPFAAASLGLATYRATLARIDSDLAKKIDSAILARIEAEVAMRDAISARIAAVKRRPQISLAWSSNLRDETGPNQHRFHGIVDYRMAPRLELTANVGVDLLERKDIVLPPEIDTTMARAAAALRLMLAEPGPGLLAKPPVTVTASADLQWQTQGNTFRVQLKVDFPLMAGLSLPISLSWADAVERIDEKEVRGTFGFTIDTSKLASALR